MGNNGVSKNKSFGAAVAFIALLPLCACKKDSAETLAPLEEIDVAPNPETITVRVENYCASAGLWNFKDLFASNLSSKVYKGRLYQDNDKDGVPDEIEIPNNASLNISTIYADSNDDGVSDLTIYLSGITKPQQRLLRCLDRNATDGEGFTYRDPKLIGPRAMQFLGLTNCEKKFLNLDAVKFDTDGDGIPDYLEMRCGLNPRDPYDAAMNPAGDKVTNYEKCKKNVPVDESLNPNTNRKFEYQYSTDLNLSKGPKCYNFTISNVPIVNGGYDNLVVLHLIESDATQAKQLFTAMIPVDAGSKGATYLLDFGKDFAKR